MKLATDDSRSAPLPPTAIDSAPEGQPLWTQVPENAQDGDFPIEGDAGSANGDGKAAGTVPPPPTAS